ncbi:4772_t:CDS:2, partial [Cetraspora pellucida]
MSQQHIRGPGKHRFTNNIIVLGTKLTNKHNTYGVCKACNNALDNDSMSDVTTSNNTSPSTKAISKKKQKSYQ